MSPEGVGLSATVCLTLMKSYLEVPVLFLGLAGGPMADVAASMPGNATDTSGV